MRLNIEHVSKSYGTNRALVDFTASLEPGVYALLGPNGSGKSTLMNIITDNLAADEGLITYTKDGGEAEDVLKMGVRFRRELGFMPQYPGMYTGFTVERFLWYIATLKDVGAHLKGRDRKAYVADEIAKVLEAVELSDVADRRIGALSGGMKQRLALAQAVLGDPSVLILDEPTAGLDPKQRISVRNYISRIAFNKIVIIATHLVPDVEYIAKSAIILKKGVIVDCASPAELAQKIVGKVWSASVPETEVAEMQQRYRITGIAKDEAGDTATLRILSDTVPVAGAVSVPPSLEDYSLYVFGEQLDAHV